MHPFLRNRVQLLVYLLLWVGPVAYFTYVLTSAAPAWPLREALPVALGHGLLLAALFLSLYPLCRAFPLRQTDLLPFLATHAGTIVAASGVWLAAGWAMVWVLDRTDGGSSRLEQYQSWMPHLFFFAEVALSMAQAVNYLLLSMEDQRQAESARELMRTLAREAELRSLRAQINPHFLFNSLNSVSALTTIDPKRAREMCLLLAEFFRRNLDIGNQTMVPLGDELDLVVHYLRIEQERFGPRLQMELDAPAEIRSFPVPPLILQPLVENAVKHGIAGMVEGGKVVLRVRSLTNGGVSIVVENPFDPDQPKRRRKGVGLDNVRTRLQARYGSDARFETVRETAFFRAKVQIAAQRMQADSGEVTVVKDVADKRNAE